MHENNVIKLNFVFPSLFFPSTNHYDICTGHSSAAIPLAKCHKHSLIHINGRHIANFDLRRILDDPTFYRGPCFNAWNSLLYTFAVWIKKGRFKFWSHTNSYLMENSCVHRWSTKFILNGSIWHSVIPSPLFLREWKHPSTIAIQNMILILEDARRHVKYSGLWI